MSLWASLSKPTRRAVRIATEPASSLPAYGPRRLPPECFAAQQTMVPGPVPRQMCRAGVAAHPCAGLSERLGGFPRGDVTLAISIQGSVVRFARPREMPDAGGWKNVCSLERFPRRILPQPSRVPHSARCETEGDRSFLLLFRAIAKAREVLQPSAR